MDQVFAASTVLAAGLVGLAMGAAGFCVIQVTPTAFKRLDYQRADSLVRQILKAALPWIAGFAAGAAAFAIMGTAWGAATLLVVAAGGLMLVRFCLRPMPKRARVPGLKSKRSETRIVAVQLTLLLMMLFPIALIALMLGI